MVQEIKITELNEAPYNPRIRLEPGMPEWKNSRTALNSSQC